MLRFLVPVVPKYCGGCGLSNIAVCKRYTQQHLTTRWHRNASHGNRLQLHVAVAAVSVLSTVQMLLCVTFREGNVAVPHVS